MVSQADLLGVRPWTVREERILRELWARGVPARVIAEQLGRSESAIRYRRWMLQLRSRHRPWTPEERAAVNDWQSLKEIAQKIHRTPMAVKNMRRQLKQREGIEE